MKKNIVKVKKPLKKVKGKKNTSLPFNTKGFSFFPLLIIVALSLLLAGTFQKIQTPDPKEGIPDPNSSFTNLTDKKSLQLRTLDFISTTPTPIPTVGITQATKPALCQRGEVNNESEILVGYSPANGESVGADGQVKVWVNDEGAPYIAPGEQADGTTGAITKEGDRTAKADDNYLYEPALYLDDKTAESGGTPFFPTAIKGTYNNDPVNNRDFRNSGVKGATIDPVPGATNTGLGQEYMQQEYTSEYIWNVSSLKLSAGSHSAEFVIHDGDRERGVGCISFTIK